MNLFCRDFVLVLVGPAGGGGEEGGAGPKPRDRGSNKSDLWICEFVERAQAPAS
jgi:hypothetical protein